MQNYAKAILCSLLVFLASFTIAQDSLAQNEITFAGVTHTVTPSGVYTNLGLGINFDPGIVVSACVVFPDNTTEHCYSEDQFYDEWEKHSILYSFRGRRKLELIHSQLI